MVLEPTTYLADVGQLVMRRRASWTYLVHVLVPDGVQELGDDWHWNEAEPESRKKVWRVDWSVTSAPQHLKKCWWKFPSDRIVFKGRLWVTSFIYKYKTSTTYPLYETTQCFILINKWCSWVQSTLPTICLYPQSGYDQILRHLCHHLVSLFP